MEVLHVSIEYCGRIHVLGFTNMAEAWKKLKEKVKDKQTKTGLQGNQQRPKGEELTIQHLSAHVLGKAQKV